MMSMLWDYLILAIFPYLSGFACKHHHSNNFLRGKDEFWHSCIVLQGVLETVAKITHDKAKRNDTREGKYGHMFVVVSWLLLTMDTQM